MKKILLLLLVALTSATALQAQKKTFTRDYTYQASEDDSKNSARANATTQMRNILLREVGEFIHAEQTLTTGNHTQDYAEKVEAITAGIVEMKTLDERWDGQTYYIKAEMTVDPKDLERRIAEALNDKQKTKELEEARKRTLAAEAEAARLRKELEETKNEQQRLALQKKYQQTTEALSAEEYFTKGNNAIENGWHELAIEYYQKAIAADPNYATTYYNMGLAYAKLENYREAIRCYQKAIDIDPNHTAAYYNMGNAYYNLQNYQEAIRCYQKAIAIDPNLAAAYYNMGIAYADLQNYREAIRCYQKDIAIDPNDAKAYNNMGVAYEKLENYQEAIRCYQKAIDIDPNYAAAYDNMGFAYDNLQNYKEAIRCYQKAIEVNPDYWQAHYHVGVLHYNKAISIQDAASKEPDDNKFAAMLKDLDKELRAALPAFERAYELYSEELSTVQFLKNICYRFREQSPKMMADFERYSKIIQENETR
jgi:superkiller protein 3